MMYRGIPAQQLSGRWKYGPEFLKLPEEEWPKESCITISKEIDQSEHRKAQPVFQVTKSQASEVIPCKKFSSWRKLVRVTAYVLRFINKLRNKVRKQENAETTEAKDTSEVVPISAKELEDDTKHPVLLPREHGISLLITRFVHQKSHAVVATTVAQIRKKYWIIRCHDLAKSVKFRCSVCRRMQAEVEKQFMSDLPKTRLEPLTPPLLWHGMRLFWSLPC